MFEREEISSFGRFGASICVLYLTAVTTLYALLLVIYSNWPNPTIPLFQAIWLFIYGPPLTALWTACISRIKHGDELKTLPSWVVLALSFGVVAVSATTLYAVATHPWQRMHMGGAFAAIAIVSSPALVPAILFLKDHRAARKKNALIQRAA